VGAEGLHSKERNEEASCYKTRESEEQGEERRDVTKQGKARSKERKKEASCYKTRKSEEQGTQCRVGGRPAQQGEARSKAHKVGLGGRPNWLCTQFIAHAACAT